MNMHALGSTVGGQLEVPQGAAGFIGSLQKGVYHHSLEVKLRVHASSAPYYGTPIPGALGCCWFPELLEAVGVPTNTTRKLGC